MSAWKVILATLIIFGTGVVTGGLLVSHAIRVNQGRHEKPVPTANAPMANPWQASVRNLLKRMDRDLDLTPEQRERIEKILSNSQERTKALWRPIAPQMNKEMQFVHEEIRTELNPAQRKKFDDLVKSRPMMERRRFSTNSPSLGETNSAPTNAVPANP